MVRPSSRTSYYCLLSDEQLMRLFSYNPDLDHMNRFWRSPQTLLLSFVVLVFLWDAIGEDGLAAASAAATAASALFSSLPRPQLLLSGPLLVMKRWKALSYFLRLTCTASN